MRPTCHVSLALLAISLSVSNANAAITFRVSNLPVSLDSADGSQVMALIDLNRDNRPDLAAINAAADGIEVYLNDGDGGFPAEPIHVQFGESLAAIATGNLNGDGKPDIVVVDSANDQTIILLGDGTGHFQTPQGLNLGGAAPISVVAGDFDNNGLDDIAVLSSADNRVYLLRSTSSGFENFNVRSVASRLSETMQLAALSIHNNISLVVTGGGSSGQANVLLGNGDGTFQSGRLYNVGADPDALIVAKLDGDAFPDIAVVNTGEIADENISLLFGKADGTFNADRRTTAETDSRAIAAADFDGDGKTDMVVTNVSGGVGISLVHNDPGCTATEFPSDCENGFTRSLTLGFGSAVGVQAGDLNGDGLPDIVALSDDGERLGVFLNTTDMAVTHTPTATPTSAPSPSRTPSTRGTGGGCSTIAGNPAAGSGWLLAIPLLVAWRRHRSRRSGSPPSR